MTKKLRIGNAILCEYVAQGAYNKHVLVNVYSGDIIIQTLPAAFILGLYIEVENPHEDELSPEIQVNLGGKPLFKAGGFSFGRAKNAIIAVQSFPINIERDSALEIYVLAKGYLKSKAISKTITVGAIPGQAASALLPQGEPPPNAAPGS